jgi:hypothetical protein
LLIHGTTGWFVRPIDPRSDDTLVRQPGRPYNGETHKPEPAMPAEHDAIAEANRLYWDSEESVADIADQLDLSRRALYDAVHPVSAGLACSRCGAELEYANRSARRSGHCVCPTCGAEEFVSNGDEEVDRPLTVVAGDAREGREDARMAIGDPDLRHRAMVLGGAAIAGVAIGTVATLFAIRRD